MRKEELSVGNWVYYEIINNKFILCRIEKLGQQLAIVRSIKDTTYDAKLTELSPIPIEDDVLMFNGFTRIPHKDFVEYIYKYVRIREHQKGLWNIRFDDYIKKFNTNNYISSIHELQNIFTLYNIDKELTFS